MASESDETKINWSKEPPRTVYAVVQWIRDTCETEREKGDRFERASRYFLMNDPLWRAKFRNVWMWKDAPTNDGKDLGIEKADKDKMLALLENLNQRLAEVNDGSFVVDDELTAYYSAL